MSQSSIASPDSLFRRATKRKTTAKVSMMPSTTLIQITQTPRGFDSILASKRRCRRVDIRLLFQSPPAIKNCSPSDHFTISGDWLTGPEEVVRHNG